MAPALGFLHGRALITDVYSQYGVGWPMWFAAIAPVAPLAYSTLMAVSVAYSLVYLFGVYLLVRLVTRSAPWATLASLLCAAVYLYTGNIPGTVLHIYPSFTVMRAPMDIWFFIALWRHASTLRGRPNPPTPFPKKEGGEAPLPFPRKEGGWGVRSTPRARRAAGVGDRVRHRHRHPPGGGLRRLLAVPVRGTAGWRDAGPGHGERPGLRARRGRRGRRRLLRRDPGHAVRSRFLVRLARGAAALRVGAGPGAHRAEPHAGHRVLRLRAGGLPRRSEPVAGPHAPAKPGPTRPVDRVPGGVRAWAS